MTRSSVEIPNWPDPPLPVAVSECLTGAAVRYDGSDARSSFPHEALDGVITCVPICPEVGIGMGVPRAPIQLVGDPDRPRVLGVEDPGVDVTSKLEAYARSRSRQLRRVYGYIFMERSPSCGLHSVPVHGTDGGEPVHATGRGAYAREVSVRHPRLPVEENGRLFEAAIRESFLARVFAYAHWRRLCEGGLTPARLMEFHSRYKYLLMAHSIRHYGQAGRILGNADEDALRSKPDSPSTKGEDAALCARSDRYLKCLLEGLSKPATRGGHANVLSHLQGYLSRVLDGGTRRRLTEVIEKYRGGGVPLREPREMLLRRLAHHPDQYLDKQVYLRPPWASEAASVGRN
ncbi:MAG: DUF523 and DUF1722 domain-containing protein [Gammaproteobacteria bacterium]|nr:DUF523 and DUF1722 domain-containing protein [Gammaproteobacteria bacterium]